MRQLLFHAVIPSNDANGIENSEDLDQTASLSVWVCTVCPTCLSENLRSFLYIKSPKFYGIQNMRKLVFGGFRPDQTLTGLYGHRIWLEV